MLLLRVAQALRSQGIKVCHIMTSHVETAMARRQEGTRVGEQQGLPAGVAEFLRPFERPTAGSWPCSELSWPGPPHQPKLGSAVAVRMCAACVVTWPTALRAGLLPATAKVLPENMIRPEDVAEAAMLPFRWPRSVLL